VGVAGRQRDPAGVTGPKVPTVDRDPASADRDPASADRDPATGDRDPATGDRDPATGDQPRPRVDPVRLGFDPGQRLLDFGPPPAPGFDNFIVGDNAECVAALRTLAERPSIRAVYVWGPPGSGKTHLARALGACAVPTLEVVDDCDRLDADGQVRLFHRFNDLMAAPTGTLAAFGQHPPQRLAILPDLASRLAWGIVFALQPLADHDLAAALAATARRRGFVLGDDLIGHLLRHARRDMGSLTTIVARLDHMSLATRRPMTIALLRQVMAGAPIAASASVDATHPVPGEGLR
jgi:DnaA family protein